MMDLKCRRSSLSALKTSRIKQIAQAVRKDLVIWGKGGQTTWDAAWKAKAIPHANMEWKVKRGPNAQPTISSRDRACLKGFKRKHRGFIGVCVTVAFGKKADMKWEFV